MKQTSKLFTDNSGWVVCRETKESAFEYFSHMTEKFGDNLNFAKDISEIKQVSTPFKSEKEVHDGESFGDYCSELLDNWLIDITNDGRYTRDVNEDDCVDDNTSFMYTGNGARMVERALVRLRAIGERHGFEDYEIYSSYFKEY